MNLGSCSEFNPDDLNHAEVELGLRGDNVCILQ
jgi:hypothetical protein